MTKHHRLPGSGDTTPSLKEYLDAWKGEIQPLLDATGWTLLAFDPGYSLARGDEGRDTFSLSTAAVRDLVAALRK